MHRERVASSGRIRKPVLASAALVAAMTLVAPPATAAFSVHSDENSKSDEPTLGREDKCAVSALAMGVRVTVREESQAVLADPSGVSLPVARACRDANLGVSEGFASYPYPGASAVSLPGTVGGLTGQSLPVEYPTYVRSSFPTEERKTFEQPGYLLDSSSDALSTRAVAKVGTPADAAETPVSKAESFVTSDAETGEATSEAQAVTDPLTIAGVLEIGRVKSEASAVAVRGEKTKLASALDLGKISVGGIPIGITADGITTPAGDVPLPPLSELGAVASLLAEQGVSITYLAADRGEDFIRSAGIAVTVLSVDEATGASSETVFTFGLAYARAVAPGFDPAVPIPTPTVTPAGDGETTSEPPATGGSSAVGSESTAVDAPGAAGPPASVTPPPSGEPATDEAMQLLAAPGSLGGLAIYMLLVFGAAMTFLASTMMRLLGVKSR